MSDIFFTCDVCGEQNDSPLAHACRQTALLRLIQERTAERDRLKRELEEAKVKAAGFSLNLDLAKLEAEQARRGFEAERSKADEFQKKFEIARRMLTETDAYGASCCVACDSKAFGLVDAEIARRSGEQSSPEIERRRKT